MLGYLRDGVVILLRPAEGWQALRRRGPRADEVLGLALALLLVLGPVLGGSRLLGHLVLGWPPALAAFDALLQPLLTLVLLLGLGQALALLLGRQRATGTAPSGPHCWLVALYSSPPLWLAGLGDLVPSVAVQSIAPFAGLLFTGHLFYLGLRQSLGVPGATAIPLATALWAGFIGAFVLGTQVLPVVLRVAM